VSLLSGPPQRLLSQILPYDDGDGDASLERRLTPTG
jgi:hypothetical protein